MELHLKESLVEAHQSVCKANLIIKVLLDKMRVGPFVRDEALEGELERIDRALELAGWLIGFVASDTE